MRLIGYARVSTDEQSTASQADELRAAGCGIIHEEQGSGGSRERPVLKRLVADLGPGDVLVVVRLDRLARSLSHLLSVMETLSAKGAHFRSLRDPVDTSSPQGKFTLQVLGAAAELERALIRERTVSGLNAARRNGRVGGNPGLKSGDRAALAALEAAREQTRLRKLADVSQEWLPAVRRLRPDLGWEDVTRIVNAQLPAGTRPWTRERLVRAARRFVRDGLLEARVLGRAQRRDGDDRLMAIVAAIAGSDPALTIRDIGMRLENLRERTPRGGARWSPSSVKMLLDRARRNGLLQP